MTLDEMIRLMREIYEEEREEAYTAIFPPYADACIERAENCKQIVEWLEELKKLREFKEVYQKGMDYSYATFMYKKAIDDLTNKLTSDEFQKYNLDFVFETSKSLSYNECISAFCEYIEKIANELKEHKTLNIVHCKDCIHWGTDIAGETENVKCCEYGKYMVGENGYCVYGEKECAE